ncbi:protein translocase subunit SecD [Candidatus Falkowbacteria bacterium]|nr:protein translocase subunit SecD [Candidatus Falkowbacteria bacterium]
MPNIVQTLFAVSGRARAWRVFALLMVLAIAGFLVVGGGYYNRGADWVANKTGQAVKLPTVKQVPFRLGLDLLGGTQLIYQADVSAVPAKDQPSAVEGVRDVIERRVNAFGVAEPNIQTNYSGGKYFVMAELAGIKDASQAIKMIGETPLLEFKEQNTDKKPLTAEQKKDMDKFNKDAAKKAEDVLGKVLSNGNFVALANQFSQDPDNTGSNGEKKGGSLDWVSEQDNAELFKAAQKIPVGKTSTDLSKTSSGYEIIKVEGKRSKNDPFNNQPMTEVKAAHLLICYTGVEGCESGLDKEAAKAKAIALKAKANKNNFAQLVKENSTEPGARDTGGQLGWFGRGKMVTAFENAVFAQKVGTIEGPVESDFGFHLIYKEAERKIEEVKLSHILIKTKSEVDYVGNQSDWKNTELTGKNLSHATVEFNPNDNSPQVGLEFNDEGAKQFEAITGRNVGKPVAIFLDGDIISQPTVNEAIKGGKAVISGKFDVKTAKLLAQRLNAGALPVPITLVNQQSVGASLGQKSVDDSFRAGMIAFAFVALFMIIFYRFPGLLAVFALVMYSILVLAIFKIWPVTITLSGLAGFIMSIGMAVDANVLIFSRLREELANGRPLGFALEEAFRRAWPSIRDSNASTLITCFILIEFSTSVVKGFAVTLTIGVLVSMFTAIFITRNFLKLIPESWLEKHSWLVGVPKNN